MEIDASKDVYLFVHGRSDLVEKSTAALVAKGFSQEKIIQALPQKTGNVGDYMAMLWMPPNPDHIKIQQITAVDSSVEPKGMTGAWAAFTSTGNGILMHQLETDLIGNMIFKLYTRYCMPKLGFESITGTC